MTPGPRCSGSALQADGTYRSIARSEALPMLTTTGLVLEALALCKGVAESRWGQSFRRMGPRAEAALPETPPTEPKAGPTESEDLCRGRRRFLSRRQLCAVG